MKQDLLLPITKNCETVTNQTITKAQETLEYKKKKQMQTFSFNPSKKLVEEGKCLLAVSSFECTNSVYDKTDENISFSIIIPGHY